MLRSRPTQRALAELGLTGEEVAFWGFAYTDVYQCVPIDTLHQCFNGISLHVVEALKMCIEATCRSHKDSIFARIRARFCSYRRLYHGERIPKESLWAEKTCAEVRRAGWERANYQLLTVEFLQERDVMMRFLGIALHPLDGLPCRLPAFFTGTQGRDTYSARVHVNSSYSSPKHLLCTSCAAYARYIQIRDMPRHTTGSLALLEELVFQ